MYHEKKQQAETAYEAGCIKLEQKNYQEALNQFKTGYNIADKENLSDLKWLLKDKIEECNKKGYY